MGIRVGLFKLPPNIMFHILRMSMPVIKLTTMATKMSRSKFLLNRINVKVLIFLCSLFVQTVKFVKAMFMGSLVLLLFVYFGAIQWISNEKPQQPIIEKNMMSNSSHEAESSFPCRSSSMLYELSTANKFCIDYSIFEDYFHRSPLETAMHESSFPKPITVVGTNYIDVFVNESYGYVLQNITGFQEKWVNAPGMCDEAMSITRHGIEINAVLTESVPCMKPILKNVSVTSEVNVSRLMNLYYQYQLIFAQRYQGCNDVYNITYKLHYKIEET